MLLLLPLCLPGQTRPRHRSNQVELTINSFTYSCVYTYVECSTGHGKATSGDTEGVHGVCAHCEAAFSAARRRKEGGGQASRGLRGGVSRRVPGWWRRRRRIRLLAPHAAARPDLATRQTCHLIAACFSIWVAGKRDQQIDTSNISQVQVVCMCLLTTLLK